MSYLRFGSHIYHLVRGFCVQTPTTRFGSKKWFGMNESALPERIPQTLAKLSTQVRK